MGYGSLKVSLLRSEFSSLYVLRKDNDTADTSFLEGRDAHSYILNEILQGGAEKRCLSPLNAMDEWHPENRQIE